MKAVTIFLLITNSLPLLIWPFILLPNVMSLGAYRTGNESAISILVSSTFLWGSSAYPIPWLLCTVPSVVLLGSGNVRAALFLSLALLGYLLVVISAFVAWMR